MDTPGPIILHSANAGVRISVVGKDLSKVDPGTADSEIFWHITDILMV